MKTWLIGGLMAAAVLTAPAQAQTPVTFGYLADPSHEAVMWAVRNGKVKSDTVKIEATPLDISALIQATAARTYDVVQTAAVAVPRARERGLDLRIVGTGLRYHSSGEGAGHLGEEGQPDQVAQRPQGPEARRLFAWLGRHHAHPHRARGRAWPQRRGARRRRRIRRDAGAGPAGGARHRPHRCGDADPRAGLQGAAERRVRHAGADRRGSDQKIRRAHGIGGARRLRREARREAGTLPGVPARTARLHGLRIEEPGGGISRGRQGDQYRPGILQGLVHALLRFPGPADAERHQGH